jgi:hypothetical protein
MAGRPAVLGTSGSLGKTWAETRCAHDWVQSASASVSVVNAGSASVDAKWVTLGRGVYKNGAWVADSCAYF